MFRQPFVPLALGVTLLLAACGGAATPASSPAAPSSAPPSSAAAKPAASTAASAPASAKPAASSSAGASAKPAASVSAKPAASGSAAPAASGSAAAPGQIKAAFGVLSVASDPIFAAQDLGLFKKEGLDVQLSSLESAVTIQSLVSGSVLLATGSTTNTVNAIASGADIKSVAATTQSSSLMIVSKPEIGSLNDLKGQTMAVTQPLSSSDFVTRLVLQKNGLAYNKDVKILAAGTAPAQAAAFSSGQVAAMTVPVDVANGLPAGSYKILVNVPEQHYAFSEQSLIVNGPFSRAQPQAVASYIKAYYDGSQAVLKDYDTFKSVTANHLKGSTEVQMKAGYDVFKGVWSDPANPRVTPASVQTIIDLLGADNPKIASLKYEDIVDNSFVQRLKAQGAFANGGCQGC